jgi:hypothetical protein
MRLIGRYFPELIRNADGGSGGGAADGGGEAAAAAAAAGAAKPWYEGKVDAEIIGHWDNKGWKKDDPASVAIEASKQARELAKHFGVPPEQLIKLPKDANDTAGWNGVYERLGAPKDAKDYDFTLVKHADGTDPAPALVDTMRSTAASLHLPKDRATDLAKAVVKHLDDTAAAATADRTAKLGAEKAALQQSWGANFDFNKLTAMQGAKRLGVDPETVNSLEGVVGYSKIMEMFRKIGAGTSEDTFVDRGGGGGHGIATREGAVARMAELQSDKAWVERLLKGDMVARREFDSLSQQIAGVAV